MHHLVLGDPFPLDVSPSGLSEEKAWARGVSEELLWFHGELGLVSEDRQSGEET